MKISSEYFCDLCPFFFVKICSELIFVTIVLYFSTDVGHEDQEDKDSWDTWFLHDESTYSCIRDYYDTEDGKNEGVVIYDEGSIDSDYGEEET
jgi:hypothetical protein